jgi:EAL domain-containing protein (putative c-di-GMP-specific phosphodiesterase class I)
LATEAGLIDKLTRSVFSQATQVVGGWWKLGYKFKVAMNWSAQQLNEEAAKRILRTLHEAELPPTALELEITEGVMIENSEQVAPMLASLKIKGVTICLDDFGTGYSSLSYLQRFPIDKIKIDKSFVSNMLEQREAQQIVIITTALAKNLNLKLVAEGIEDLEQAQYLNELGCHFHQGFLYSKALQGSELLLWAEQAGYLKKER